MISFVIFRRREDLIIHNIMRKPNSIIVLLYIFKQFAKEETYLICTRIGRLCPLL